MEILIFFITIVLPIIALSVYNELKYKNLGLGIYIPRITNFEENFRQAIVIGYWRSEKAISYPDPAWFVDPHWDNQERLKVLNYLTSFEPAVVYTGFIWCRFRCKNKYVGCAEFTDGFWRWPEGLAHYVKDHHVRLPDEFVRYVTKRTIPKNIDFDWWMNQWGWRTESSFLTPGFGGKLELVKWTGKSQNEAVLFIQQLLGVTSPTISEILEIINTGQQLCLSNGIDYCDAQEVIMEAQQYGLILEFYESGSK